MLRVLIMVIALSMSSKVEACSPAIPLDTIEARRAANVFVFRVISIRADGTEGRMAAGKIRVLANVRGKTTATELLYPTGWCGGISLDPGIDYIGFLSADTRTFVATATNVVPLFFGRYDRDVADSLEAVLRGKKNLEETFGSSWDVSRRTLPPPPPCPDSARARP